DAVSKHCFGIAVLAASAPDWSWRRRAADRRFYRMAGDAVLAIAASYWITGKRTMSHLALQPGFDFQKAGKDVLEIEREGLAELDQYIDQNFTLACEKIFSCTGKVVVMGMGKSG